MCFHIGKKKILEKNSEEGKKERVYSKDEGIFPYQFHD
jgi:hypothetical protein